MHHDNQEDGAEEEDYVLLDLDAVFAQVDISPDTPYVLSVSFKKSLLQFAKFLFLLTLKIVSLSSLASTHFNFFDAKEHYVVYWVLHLHEHFHAITY